jgi:hypothetical protein
MAEEDVAEWRVLTALDAAVKLTKSTRKAIMTLRSTRGAIVAFIHAAWPCNCCCSVTNVDTDGTWLSSGVPDEIHVCQSHVWKMTFR